MKHETDGTCSTHGREEKCIYILGNKINIPLEYLGVSWDNNIKKNLKEMRWESRDWIHLAEDRDQLRYSGNTIPKLRIP
jgi:hypothetical protein